MSTTTANYKLVKPELTDPANITNLNDNWDVIDQQLTMVNKTVVASSTDGVAYTAELQGITELYNGLRIRVIPNMTSTSINTTLNLNGLGAVPIKQPLSTAYITSGVYPTVESFIGKNCPMTLTYTGKNNLTPAWYTDIQRTDMNTLYGSLYVQQGGTFTNSNTKESDITSARTRLKAQAQITCGTTEPSGGVNGDVYIQIIE